mmetsp:Transcript_81879/g.154574  ORF Transcript_81879/g.154574 Transcript_81879/m.154574 type:complete len:83 (+) Transcript_81879:19-267(+)
MGLFHGMLIANFPCSNGMPVAIKTGSEAFWVEFLVGTLIATMVHQLHHGMPIAIVRWETSNAVIGHQMVYQEKLCTGCQLQG